MKQKLIRILQKVFLLVAVMVLSSAGLADRALPYKKLRCDANPVKSGANPFDFQLRLLEIIPATCPGCPDYQIFEARFPSGAKESVSVGYYRRDWLYVADANDPGEGYAHSTCASFLNDGAKVHLSLGTGDGGISHCLSCEEIK